MMNNKNFNPNLVIIGNTAFDTKEYMIQGKKRERDIGGACLYASIPASLFYNVGIVTKVGKDFNLREIQNYDLNIEGLKIINENTTHFYTKFFSEDGQESTTFGKVSDNMTLTFEDIPKKFLQARHIHFTTSEPKSLLKMIKLVKNYSKAKLSVDTNNWFSKMKETREIFDIVDTAFIDKEFVELLKCNAKTKIIKLGKEGCIFKSNEKEFFQAAKIKQSVKDKLGAGDCLNGVFINLIANGISEKEALKKAVEIATLSIDNYGIINIKNYIEN